MLPKFVGNDVTLAHKVVDWIDEQLVHTKLTPHSMWQIGKRTPREILESRRIVTAFGCLDKVALIATLLRQNGADAWIVWQRVYHGNKPLGIHFLVEAEDRGKKFTVDPHTVKTDIYSGWTQEDKPGHLSQPFKGSTAITYKKVNRVHLTTDGENKRTFDITGVKSRIGYMRASNVSPLRYVQFVLSRSGKKSDARIKRISDKRKKQKRA